MSAALRPLLLFKEGAPRDDEVPAAFLVLDDPERVDVAFVFRRVAASDDVDLGERAERALAGDAHFIPALHRLFHLAFDRKTAVERVFELPQGRGPERQPPGECQPSDGRHHGRLDAVAGSDLETAIGVLQFVDIDDRLALAADVDERHLRADRDDPALDGLPLLDAFRLE